MLDILYHHIGWLIDSINNKILFLKSQSAMIDFAKEIYCDEILDSLSMLIFLCICVRKDNDLRLRKDNLSVINQI
jgi:hypothetical protein